MDSLLPGTDAAAAWFRQGLVCPPPDAQKLVLIPGSFNPLHRGHQRLREAASELLQQHAVFEMSITNVDKPPLTAREVRDRLRQFRETPVAVTRAPTFVSKSRLFPESTFVVGVDTAARLLDARYGDGTPESVVAALRLMHEQGVSFLVAARVDASGALQTLASLSVPVAFRPMFRAIPADVFREDVSSTQLRRRSQPG